MIYFWLSIERRVVISYTKKHLILIIEGRHLIDHNSKSRCASKMGSTSTMVSLDRLIKSLIDLHNQLSSTTIHDPSLINELNQFLQSTTVKINTKVAELYRSSQRIVPGYPISSQFTDLQNLATVSVNQSPRISFVPVNQSPRISFVPVNQSHQCLPVQMTHFQNKNPSTQNFSGNKKYHVPRTLSKTPEFKKKKKPEASKAPARCHYILLEKRGPNVKYPIDPEVHSKQIKAIESLFEKKDPGTFKSFLSIIKIENFLKKHNLYDRGLPRGSIRAILKEVSEVGNKISNTDVLIKLFPLSDGISRIFCKYLQTL